MYETRQPMNMEAAKNNCNAKNAGVYTTSSVEVEVITLELSIIFLSPRIENEKH